MSSFECGIGDVMRMKKWTHRIDANSGPMEFVYASEKGKIGVFLFLGTEPSDGSAPIDPVERLRQFGFERVER